MTDQDFGNMITQYERLVYSICYQFTRNHHTAQDLAQDTFLSAYSHLDSCPADNIKPWLARIATNKAKDYLKSAYNRRVAAADDTILGAETNALFLQAEQPEELALSREDVRLIEEEIHALKEPYHQVAVLFFIQEKSVDEIATHLDRPTKTVHTQIYRARNLLQKKLKGES